MHVDYVLFWYTCMSRIHILMRLPYIHVHAHICVTLRPWIKIQSSPLSSWCGLEQWRRWGAGHAERSDRTLNKSNRWLGLKKRGCPSGRTDGSITVWNIEGTCLYVYNHWIIPLKYSIYNYNEMNVLFHWRTSERFLQSTPLLLDLPIIPYLFSHAKTHGIRI